MGEVKVDLLCRLCLTPVEADQLVNIFDDASNLPVRIMACCSLEIQRNDALPKNVCLDCRYQLDKTYIFRLKSKNAEARLKRHFRMLAAGKTSYFFEEEEEVDEYEDALQYVTAHEEKIRLAELEVLKSETDVQVKRAKVAENLMRTDVQRLKMSVEQKSDEIERLKQEIVELQAVRDAMATSTVDGGTATVVATQDDEYYVEMLEEDDMKPVVYNEIEHMETEDPRRIVDHSKAVATDDVDENTIEARYECDPEEYAAIEKAVRVSILCIFIT